MEACIHRLLIKPHLTRQYIMEISRESGHLSFSQWFATVTVIATKETADCYYRRVQMKAISTDEAKRKIQG